jgi:hypothetical protein
MSLGDTGAISLRQSWNGELVASIAEDSGGQAALLTSASTFGRDAGNRLRNAFSYSPFEYARRNLDQEMGSLSFK